MSLQTQYLQSDFYFRAYFGNLVDGFQLCFVVSLKDNSVFSITTKSKLPFTMLGLLCNGPTSTTILGYGVVHLLCSILLTTIFSCQLRDFQASPFISQNTQQVNVLHPTGKRLSQEKANLSIHDSSAQLIYHEGLSLGVELSQECSSGHAVKSPCYRSQVARQFGFSSVRPALYLHYFLLS